MAQPTTDLNVIAALAPMTWRGLEAPPYEAASFRGGHDYAIRMYPYIDAASHEYTGRKPFELGFKLYFLNSLRPKLFPDLYTEWEKLVIFDGTPGKLYHPVLGWMQAVCIDWFVAAEATSTSGVVVDVAFVETIEDLTAKSEPGMRDFGLVEVAAAADVQMEELSIEWPTGERVDSLADLLKQIEGALFSARLTMQGMINQAIGLVGGIIESVSKIQDHARWALDANLKQLSSGLKDLQSKADTLRRKTRTYLTPRAITLDEIATEVNNSLTDVIALNPTLLKYQKVPAKTSVLVYAQ